MATASNGILGPIVGRVGTVTGYMRNGIPVLRIATRKKDNIQSPARLAQREKLKLCNTFTRAFTGTDFFKKTFPAYGHTGTGLHRASSAVMNLAIKGVYPALSISYPDILVSRGNLPGAANAQAAAGANGRIEFTWDDNSDVGTAGTHDQAVLVAFDMENHQAVFTLQGGARHTRMASLNVSHFNGQTVATWVSFVNEKGDAADSVFCGVLTVGT